MKSETKCVTNIDELSSADEKVLIYTLLNYNSDNIEFKNKLLNEIQIRTAAATWWQSLFDCYDAHFKVGIVLDFIIHSIYRRPINVINAILIWFNEFDKNVGFNKFPTTKEVDFPQLSLAILSYTHGIAADLPARKETFDRVKKYLIDTGFKWDNMYENLGDTTFRSEFDMSLRRNLK